MGAITELLQYVNYSCTCPSAEDCHPIPYVIPEHSPMSYLPAFLDFPHTGKCNPSDLMTVCHHPLKAAECGIHEHLRWRGLAYMAMVLTRLPRQTFRQFLRVLIGYSPALAPPRCHFANAPKYSMYILYESI